MINKVFLVCSKKGELSCNESKAKSARCRKSRPKVMTRKMRKEQTADFDSLPELADDFEDYEEDALESDFVTASEAEQEPTAMLPHASRLPYASLDAIPEGNAREKWYKEWILEIFVPVARDGSSEEDTTLGSGPTWSSDSETEEEAPPPEKPRPITMTEMKRNMVKAQILAGTKTTVIMETLNVSHKLVYRVMKLMRENPDDDRAMAVKPRPGKGPRSPELLRVLKETFESDPTLHYTFVAKQLGVSRWTVSRGLGDMNMRSYVRRYRAIISAGAMVKRVERAEELLEWISAHPSTVLIFSDKVQSTNYNPSLVSLKPNSNIISLDYDNRRRPQKQAK